MSDSSDTLHIAQRGSGSQPLVLVHGWAMHGGLFEPLIEALGDRFCVYLLDLPGHGHNHDCTIRLSPTETIEAARAQLPEQAIWLGWSLGGLFAIEAARQGLASGLVMLASTPCFVRKADWPHAVEAEVFEAFANGLENSVEATLKRFLLLETHGSDHPKQALQALQSALAEWPTPSVDRLQEGLTLLRESDARETLRTLETTTLWMMGRRDKLVPWQAAQSLASEMARSRVRLFRKAGHAPFVTHAESVADSLRRFADYLTEGESE